MKCPECVKEGKRSNVAVGMSTTTCAYYTPYYDEEGVYHHHDGNTTTTHYSCSQGHRWTTGHTGRCPNCDFGKETP